MLFAFFVLSPSRTPGIPCCVVIECVVYLNSPCCVYSFEHLPVCHVPRKLDSINDRFFPTTRTPIKELRRYKWKKFEYQLSK